RGRRGGAGRRREQARCRTHDGPHPPQPPRPLRRRRTAGGRDLRPRPHQPRRSPPPVGRAGRGHGPAPPQGPHPGGGGLTEARVPGGVAPCPHLALVGPTASGKSTLALEVARRLPGPPVELVSVDSMQLYRGMDIGTAKATAAEQAEIPHHLLDLADPGEDFSVTRFAEAAATAVAGIEARGHRALLVGGTGLYLRAV